MTCDQIEDLILDSLDESLAQTQAESLSEHLTQCAACREFAKAHRALDAKLSTALKPVVSPVFVRESVFQIIDQEIAAGRKKAALLAEAEAEYRRCSATLRSSVKIQPKRWIDSIAWVVGVIAFGFCLLEIMRATISSDWAVQLSIDPLLLSGSIAALFCIAAAIGVARSFPFLFSIENEPIESIRRS